ncbi:hypothetical protein EV191_11686 [Tamaricihabitans halophyticus]|uniref:Uridine kinase n=1 Tax=Tamaricihabitans halophyticus TaxID=1262583 RepID=A0A4R2Q957_9PSEU|nr:uridine kinase [Tamaricihabitans halophyticus]TCP45443.1 hypothetical protein EV191_11686 [Tamaricihabitans halophyticus]
MRLRPITPERFVDELADTLAAGARERSRLRVAVDGAPAARPEELADTLVDPLRLRGIATVRVSAWDFQRPASVRLERGRTNPAARSADWVDAGALRREVLLPLGEDGNGYLLPALWDTTTDRSVRASRQPLPTPGVLLLDGELLLGRQLPFDHVVHLWLSHPALARKTPPDEHWALPAYQRYERTVNPLVVADTVLRVDEPRRPALRVATER